MYYSLKFLLPMRIASLILIALVTLSVQPADLIAQTSIRLLTGPTSFTGSSNLEDGIQVSSAGTYSYQVAVSSTIKPHLSLEGQLQWGELGLTSAERMREKTDWNGVSLSARLHTTYSKDRQIQPWISAGVMYMHQSNKEDLMDADGQLYHFWSDGQAYNMPEESTNSDNEAEQLVPDYTFETCTATNKSLAFPIQAGLNLNLTSRLYASASMAVIIGMESTLDPRPNYIDWLTTVQAGIGVRLGKAYSEPEIKYPEALLRLGSDADGDGVKDVKDRCPGTPNGAPVDKQGCPTDIDGDGIPDYRDEEPHSPHRRVNEAGIALSEAQWAATLQMQTSQTGTMKELFERIESDSDQQIVTPVNADGRTPAEMRLLKTFGHEKSSTPAAKPTQKKGLENFKKTEERTSYRSVAPSIRPLFRVQLGEDIRQLDMDAVSPLLTKGEVSTKFNNHSKMYLVTPTLFSMASAKARQAALIEAGFENAQIIGDFNGSLMDLDVAQKMHDQWMAQTAASNN